MSNSKAEFCDEYGDPFEPSEDARELISSVRMYRHLLTPKERILLLAEAKEAICDGCGTCRLPCHCQNDE